MFGDALVAYASRGHPAVDAPDIACEGPGYPEGSNFEGVALGPVGLLVSSAFKCGLRISLDLQ
eukprot:9555249-Alexandrium_andersonii.AAC.1